jgi:hypothetical protein
MRRTATVVFAVVALALAGCSSGGEDDPPKTVTVTASPSLSEAEARQACVDEWLVVLQETPDDAPDVEDKPAVCEGLSGQAGMYAEALMARNQANRDKHDACTRDPACASWPVP